jgi:hypothetical protein
MPHASPLSPPSRPAVSRRWNGSKEADCLRDDLA